MSKLLLGSAILLGSATAQAATVTGTILADNGSIAVLEQGSFTVIAPSVAGNWPTPKANFTFNVADDPVALRSCKIHVISWGDGSVAQGVMAHFASTGGVTFTGQPGSSLNNVYLSSVQHGGSTAAGQAFANNNANAQNIIQSIGAPSTGFTSQSASTGGIPGTWGPVPLPEKMEGRGQVAFVWDSNSQMLNANPRNYRVISTPCDKVVRPVQPPAPVPHVNSWEIAGQFNPAPNIGSSTFEVWSYGYTDAADCSGPFIPFKNWITRSFSGQNLRGWRRGPNGNDTASLPEVTQTSASTMTNPLRFAPMGLSMHPGSNGECAIVRFTAPETGNYRMMGRFWAQNVTAGGTNVTTSVFKNAGSIDGAPMTITAPSGSTNNPFNWNGSLNQGDVVDFRVGANGSFLNDSTGLHGYIERITP
jgi:hypothetical protein